MILTKVPARRVQRRATRCEVCKTERYADARRQCELCGANACRRCVVQWHGYDVCRNCLGQ